MLDLYHRLGGLYGRFGLGAKIGLVLAMSAVTTLAGVVVIVCLPADHFRRSGAGRRRRHPVVRWGLLVLKNTAGLLVVPLAVITLIGPGPGILFTLIAFSLLDIPGKRALERRLLARPGVVRSLNNVRGRFGRPPLVIDPP